MSETSAGDLHSPTNGAFPVLHYRAYVLDNDGKIEDVRLVEATDDAGACEEARSLGFIGRIELWCRDRLISCRGFTRRQRPVQGDPFCNRPLLGINDRSAH